MGTELITSKPEVNASGTKRWFIGDLDQGNKRVFLFEVTKEQQAADQCTKYMVGTYDDQGVLLREKFFDRTYERNRFLCRMFDVDAITLCDDPELQEAA